MKHGTRVLSAILALLMCLSLLPLAALADDEPLDGDIVVEEIIEEEAPSEEPAQEPGEEPIEEPGEEPVEEPAEEPVEEPAEEPIEEPVEEPVEEPAEESVEEPVEEPAEEPEGEPTEELAVEPIEEPAEEPGEEPIEEPDEEPAEEHEEEPTEELAVEPIEEPAEETVEEPEEEPTEEPIEEPAEEESAAGEDVDDGQIVGDDYAAPQSDLSDGDGTGVPSNGSLEEAAPAAEPVEEPAAEEPAEEPIEEPDEEPAEEPVEEPAEEPVEEPAEEPALDGSTYDTTMEITLDSSGVYSTSDSAVAQKLWDYFYYSIRTETINGSDIEELNGYGCLVDLNKDSIPDLSVQIPWTGESPSSAYITGEEGLEYMRNYGASNILWHSACSFDGDTYDGTLKVNFTPSYHIVRVNYNGGTTSTGLSIVDYLLPAGSEICNYYATPKLDLNQIGYVMPQEGYYLIEDSFFSDPSDEDSEISMETYIPTGDTTIYYHWLKLHNVTLNGNGGKFVTGNTSETLYVYPGDSLYNACYYGPDLTDVVPGDLGTYYGMERDGWLCIGFSTTESGALIDGDLVDFTPSGDVTLYAQWAKAVTLTIADNFSGGDKWTVVEAAGTTLHAKEDLAEFNPRPGYVCTGYSTDAAGKNPVSIKMVDGHPVYVFPDQDAVWYCQWSLPDKVSITRDLSGGTQFFAEGETVDILDITAAGKGLTYQWQQAEKSAYESLFDAAFQNIAGATKSAYEFTMTASCQDSYFRCVVKDTNGNTAYSTIQLVQLMNGIMKDPVNFTGAAGETATFTVKASGRNKSYAWHAKNGSMDVKVDTIPGVKGENTATLSVPITASLDNYLFFCTVTAEGAVTDSEGAHLYVGKAIDTIALTVSLVPAAGNYVAGTSIATAAEGVDSLTPSWSYSSETPEDLAKFSASDLSWTTPYPGSTFTAGFTYILCVEIIADSGYGYNLNTKITVNGKALNANHYEISATNGLLYAYVLYTLKADISKAAVTGITNATYTGSAFTPVPVVKLGNQVLYKDYDYTVSYTKNTNAGTATVTITGQGNFTGTATKSFTINPAPLNSATVTAANQTYTGSALTPAPTVKLGSKTLVKDTDYTVAYANNINAGTATVTITGKGNYTGTAAKTFTIGAASLTSDAVTVVNQTYTGSALTPAPTVKLGSKTLVKDTDYTVAYANNINAGTATVTITGKGNCTGTVTKNFTISAASLTSDAVTVVNQTYTGSALTPAPTVKLGSKTLTPSTDYTVAYANNVNAGTATVTITGKGNYTGTVTKTFTIGAASLTSEMVTLSKTKLTYNGKTRKPAVTVTLGGKELTRDTDFTVTYANNKNVGTATVTVTGIGNYTGTAAKTFTIKKASLTSGTLTLADTKVTYSGDPCEPEPAVTLNSKTLKKGTDYTVTYKNNVNVGKATVVIKGTGNYKGKLTKKFTIQKAANVITVSSTKITKAWSASARKISLGVKRLGEAKMSYSSSNSKITVKKGKVTIPANFVGKTTITIKAKATDNYKAKTIKVTITVKPAKVAVKSVTAGSKKLTLKWTKSENKNLTGYQIQYSTSKKFTKATTASVNVAASKASKTISKLTGGKTYYVRIRAYQEVGKSTYYSAWSAVKNVKVKK